MDSKLKQKSQNVPVLDMTPKKVAGELDPDPSWERNVAMSLT